MSFFENIKKNIKPIHIEKAVQAQPVNLPEFQYVERKVNTYVSDIVQTFWDGDKFFRSFGTTKDFAYIDYYTLRKRSIQLFRSNPYCRALIRRLLRNEIGTGLSLEPDIISSKVGITEDQAIEITEQIATDWKLWSNDEYIVDYNRQKTLHQLAADARQTALISGDCLIVMDINPATKLPYIRIIDGSEIQTPFEFSIAAGHEIKYGIEFDAQKRQVAYWVANYENGLLKHKRIPAYGVKSGRKIAWMIYGTDRLLDEVRGEPILAIMLTMINDLDKYKDAELRAAVVNAIIPLYISKTQPTPGSGIMMNGATKRETATATDSNGSTRNLQISSMIPGTVVNEMAYGEQIQSFDTKRPNINFKSFQDAMLDVFAFVAEIPPEIYKLQFQSNYSASRQANNEYEIYLQFRYFFFGKEFYQPIYNEFFVSSVMLGKYPADNFLDAWWNSDWQTYNSWILAEWTGLSRPSVDIMKDVSAAKEAIGMRISTYDKQAKKISGMSFSAVLKKLARENDMMKKYGIISSVDENNNGEPIGTNNDQINLKLNDIIDNLENIKES